VVGRAVGYCTLGYAMSKRCPDYLSAAINLWYQDGNRGKYKDALPTSKDYYLDRAVQIVDAALGDKVLYEEPVERCLLHFIDGTTCVDCHAQQRWVAQVWPTDSDSVSSPLVEGNNE